MRKWAASILLLTGLAVSLPGAGLSNVWGQPPGDDPRPAGDRPAGDRPPGDRPGRPRPEGDNPDRPRPERGGPERGGPERPRDERPEGRGPEGRGPEGRGPEGPHRPQGESVTVKGEVARISENIHGDVDGVILNDGTRVAFPPHVGNRLKERLTVGTLLKVDGHKERTPRGMELVHARALTPGEGETIQLPHPPTPPGPPGRGPEGRGPDGRGPGPEGRGPGPRGEMDGPPRGPRDGGPEGRGPGPRDLGPEGRGPGPGDRGPEGRGPDGRGPGPRDEAGGPPRGPREGGPREGGPREGGPEVRRPERPGPSTAELLEQIELLRKEVAELKNANQVHYSSPLSCQTSTLKEIVSRRGENRCQNVGGWESFTLSGCHVALVQEFFC